MGSAVVFLNVEVSCPQPSLLTLIIPNDGHSKALLTKRIVAVATKEAGRLFEGIHPHSMVFEEDLATKNCSLCRKRLTLNQTLMIKYTLIPNRVSD